MTEKDHYLKELRRALPFLHRRRILTEIRHHLLVATAAETAAGHDPLEAERLAVERLGPPEVLAERFREDLSGRTIRVTTRQLFAGSAVLVAALGAALAAAIVVDASHTSPTRVAVAQGDSIAQHVSSQYHIDGAGAPLIAVASRPRTAIELNPKTGRAMVVTPGLRFVTVPATGRTDAATNLRALVRRLLLLETLVAKQNPRRPLVFVVPGVRTANGRRITVRVAPALQGPARPH